jgi:ribonuclease J
MFMVEKYHSRRHSGNFSNAPQPATPRSSGPSNQNKGFKPNFSNKNKPSFSPKVNMDDLTNFGLDFLNSKPEPKKPFMRNTTPRPNRPTPNSFTPKQTPRVNNQAPKPLGHPNPRRLMSNAHFTSKPGLVANKFPTRTPGKPNSTQTSRPAGTPAKFRTQNSEPSVFGIKNSAKNFALRPTTTSKTAVPKILDKKLDAKIKEPRLRIIPLGGMEEVGRNMTIFEYGDDIVILDMGLQFPEEDMFGIDFIIPNISYLKGKEQNIRAVILSHGHLDHIGAAPMLLEALGYPPIIARPLTLALLKNRQEDYKPNSTNLLKTIQIKDIKETFSLGNFRLKLFAVDHSIMDAVGVILETPTATILHPGDWTLERDEHGKAHLDFSRLANLKRPTVLMLESLGATDVRHSASTQEMQKNLTSLVSNAKGRVIIGTFASQIERLDWIIDMAEKLGKKIVVDGRSMKTNIEIAQQLGYIKPAKHTLIKAEMMNEFPDNKIVILATGAQGETNASLSRILSGDHRTIKIQKNDTVIFSSSVIPGNERSIQTLKDKLYRQCDNVVHGDLMDIHVSGHGNREDILYLLRQVRPDYFIPVYAYHYMLREAKKLAEENGFKSERVFILDNGQVAEFDRVGGKVTKEKANTDYVMVDGLGVGDVSDIVLRDRKAMAEDGMIVVISTIDSKTGELIGSPDIISRGFIYMKENKELIQKTREKIKNIIKTRPTHGVVDDDYIKNKVRNDIGQFLFQQTKRRPMVLPVVIRV